MVIGAEFMLTGPRQDSNLAAFSARAEPIELGTNPVDHFNEINSGSGHEETISAK
jgi:hypothetical protein